MRPGRGSRSRQGPGEIAIYQESCWESGLTVNPGSKPIRTAKQPRRGNPHLLESLLCHTHPLNPSGFCILYIILCPFHSLLTSVQIGTGTLSLSTKSSKLPRMFQSFASRTIPCVELRRDLTCGRGQGGRASPACSEEEYTAAAGTQVTYL